MPFYSKINCINHEEFIMNLLKKSKHNKPAGAGTDSSKKAKNKKIILFSSIGVLGAATIALSAVLIYKSVTGYVGSDNRNNYAIDEYHSSSNNKKFEYLHSVELNDVAYEGRNEPVDINAHSFVIGKVINVPFFASAGVKFEYEETSIRISFTQINMQTISNTLSHTTSKSENYEWKETENFDEEFKAHAEVGVSKFKATTDFSIKHGINSVEGGSLSTVYTSSNEQTISSCEAFQKSQDYTIQMKTSNGFEKGKYYRLTLQQSVSMYITVYELPKSSTNAEPRYFYEINNFLDNPMDYNLIIEKSNDASFKEVESPRFDPDIYDDCIYYIENDKLDYTNPPTHEELVGSAFQPDSVESDAWNAPSSFTVSNQEYNKNNLQIIEFPKLFNSCYEPTLNDITGNGHKNLDITLDMTAKRTTSENGNLTFAVIRDKEYITKVISPEQSASAMDQESYNYYYEITGIQLKDIKETLTLAFKVTGSSVDDAQNADPAWQITRLNIKARVYK